MPDIRCPGQDMRYWTPEDIAFVPCPFCDREIEFWRDEPFRLCPGCRREIKNPHRDLGCAKWCKQAHACLGTRPDDPSQAETVCERLLAVLEKASGKEHPGLVRARQVRDQLAYSQINPDEIPIHLAVAILEAYLGEERENPPAEWPGCILAGAGLETSLRVGIEGLWKANRTKTPKKSTEIPDFHP